MPRDLRILNVGEFFLYEGDRETGMGYQLCYPYVITFSLFNFWSKGGTTEESEEALNELKSAVENRRIFRRDEFMEAFPLIRNNGFVVTDQGNGCYPMLIYSENVPRDGKERETAFKLSIEDVITHHAELKEMYDSINFPDDWDESFQERLRNIFPHFSSIRRDTEDFFRHGLRRHGR